jgi:hypothetical protein
MLFIDLCIVLLVSVMVSISAAFVLKAMLLTKKYIKSFLIIVFNIYGTTYNYQLIKVFSQCLMLLCNYPSSFITNISGNSFLILIISSPNRVFAQANQNLLKYSGLSLWFP